MLIDTYLLAALDDIKGDDSSVGKTARKHSTQGAEAVEFGSVQLDWLRHLESIAPVTDKQRLSFEAPKSVSSDHKFNKKSNGQPDRTNAQFTIKLVVKSTNHVIRPNEI